MLETSYSIGLRELRQHASKYVDLAEHGETVEVARHGKPVARLVPVVDPDDPIAELTAAGVVLPPDEAGDLLDVEPAQTDAGSGASDELMRMRDEERW